MQQEPKEKDCEEECNLKIKLHCSHRHSVAYKTHNQKIKHQRKNVNSFGFLYLLTIALESEAWRNEW
jgi:hypothetical protein